MPIKIAGRKLKKGTSMSVTPSEITPKIQSLINRGLLTLSQELVDPKPTPNSEPDEDLPDTEPAPVVPPEPVKIKTVPVAEVSVKSIDASVEKPKITKRRRKKVTAPKE